MYGIRRQVKSKLIEQQTEEKKFSHFHRLTVIEQENRQIQREIDIIREEIKEEDKEEEKIPMIQLQETPKSNSIKARTAHRRVPGLIKNFNSIKFNI